MVQLVILILLAWYAVAGLALLVTRRTPGECWREALGLWIVSPLVAIALAVAIPILAVMILVKPDDLWKEL